MKPQDYYFMYSKDSGVFFFVLKTYWEENKCIDDSSLGSEFEELLPIDEESRFLESSESAYCCYKRSKALEYISVKSATQKLVDAGFTQLDNPWE